MTTARGAAALLLTFCLALPALARTNDALISEETNFARLQQWYLRQSVDRFENSDRGRADRTELTYRVAYGVMHNFEVGADLPYLVFSNNQSGIGDLRFYQKYKFREENYEGPALVGGLALILPTGDQGRGTGTDKAGFELFGTAMRTFGDWTGNAHLGYRFQGNSNYDNLFIWGVALSTPLPQLSTKLRAVLELQGTKGDYSDAYAVPGLIWEPKDDFSVGLGLRLGLTSDGYDYGTAFRIGHDF